MPTVLLRRRLFLAGLATCSLATLSLTARLGSSQEASAAKSEVKTAADQKKLSTIVAKGLEYLKTKG